VQPIASTTMPWYCALYTAENDADSEAFEDGVDHTDIARQFWFGPNHKRQHEGHDDTDQHERVV